MLRWFKREERPTAWKTVPIEPSRVIGKTITELQIELQSLLARFGDDQFFTPTISERIVTFVEKLDTSTIQAIHWDNVHLLDRGDVISTILAQIVVHASQNENWAKELTNRIILEGKASDINWNYTRMVCHQPDMTIFARIVFYASKTEDWALTALDSLFKTVPLVNFHFNTQIVDEKTQVTPLLLLAMMASIGHPQYLTTVLIQHLTQMGALDFNVRVMGRALLDILFANPSCHPLISWITLTSLKIDTSILSLQCILYIDKIRCIIADISKKMWHFRQVQSDLPEEKYLDLYQCIAYQSLEEYLKNIPKEFRKKIIEQALNKHFYYEPKKMETEKWAKVSSQHDLYFEQRSYIFLAKLGARKVYEETPITNPNLLIRQKGSATGKPLLIGLIEERINTSLEELKKKKIIPSFIDHVHRTLIVDELAKRRELNKEEIMEVITSSYALKKVKLT